MLDQVAESALRFARGLGLSLVQNIHEPPPKGANHFALIQSMGNHKHQKTVGEPKM
jgi:hypothetical protein